MHHPGRHTRMRRIAMTFVGRTFPQRPRLPACVRRWTACEQRPGTERPAPHSPPVKTWDHGPGPSRRWGEVREPRTQGQRSETPGSRDLDRRSQPGRGHLPGDRRRLDPDRRAVTAGRLLCQVHAAVHFGAIQMVLLHLDATDGCNSTRTTNMLLTCGFTPNRAKTGRVRENGVGNSKNRS